MANEPSQVEGPYEVHDFTVAEAVLIEKFTVCKLTDPRTAAASSSNDIFAGIAATEHKASVNKTELGLWTNGIFLSTFDTAVSAGAQVSLSGANIFKEASAAELLTGAACGKLLQDVAASGGTGEVKFGGNL